MASLFSLLSFLALLCLILGLIKPAWVIRWGERKTRLKVLLIYGLAFLILSGVAGQLLEEKAPKKHQVAQVKIEQKQKPAQIQPKQIKQAQEKQAQTKQAQTKQIQTKEKQEKSPAPAETPKVARKFSKLEITDVTYENGKVKISGVTDLPDGAKLTVELDVADRSPKAPYIGVSKEVKVKNGKFEAELIPPDLPEYASGNCVVGASFYPGGQPESIRKLVGRKGENLTGSKVKPFSHSRKMMETTKKVHLPIKIASYPKIDPSHYPEGTPERAFAEFLYCWKMKDWLGMSDFVQLTWKLRQKDPARFLENAFGFKRILGAKIIGVKMGPLINMRDVTAIVFYAIGPRIHKVLITARVIYEAGKWGVNPISAFRETPVKEEDSSLPSSSHKKAQQKICYIGNKKTKVFHLPSCRWAKKIAPSNRVTFDSYDEAIEAGYRPCKVCKPKPQDK